jgi:hypothetical protein
MDKRPVAVIFYSALLVLNAIVAFLGTVFMLMIQGEPTAQTSIQDIPAITTMDYAMWFAGAAVYLACGIGLFLRQGWMRFVFLAWAALSLIQGLLSQHLTVYFTMHELVFVGVLCVFLFSSNVNAWFARAAMAPDAHGP